MENDFILEDCEFLRALRDRCAPLYKKATESNWVIAVPQQVSLQYILLSVSVLKAHVLQPSKYLQSYYATGSGKQIKIVSDDSGQGSRVVTAEGFSLPDSIRILRDEKYYTKNMKPYRILLLERPIEGTPDPQAVASAPRAGSQQRSSSSTSLLYVPKDGFETVGNLKRFLMTHVQNPRFYTELENEIAMLRDSYVLVESHHEDLRSRVLDLYEEFCELALEASPELNEHVKSQPFVGEMVRHAVHCWIVDEIYPKVISHLHQVFKEQDQKYAQWFDDLKFLRLSNFDMPSKFHAFSLPPSIVDELQNIDSKTTVYEKVLCLRNCTRELSMAVHLFQKFRKYDDGLSGENQKDGIEPLTTEDLIPLLSFAIVTAQLPHAQSTVEFLQLLQLPEFSVSELGFYVVSFRAALEFVKSVRDKKTKGDKTRTVMDDSSSQRDEPKLYMSLLKEEEHADLTDESIRRSRRHTLLPTKMDGVDQPTKKNNSNSGYSLKRSSENFQALSLKEQLPVLSQDSEETECPAHSRPPRKSSDYRVIVLNEKQQETDSGLGDFLSSLVDP
eukprot:ANDGO_06080.mRNA.1 vacuolar sorting protein 9 (vps9) domain containing protein